jgi:PKD repeat protein
VKLSFRQGIARYQTDVLHTPTFLQKSAGDGAFIDLVVSPDPTIVAFAHRSSNYIVEEVKTVPRAWGPFTSNQTVYLYWDINLLTAEVTRGSTILPPIFAGVPPTAPIIDQHWFNPDEGLMRVWNGQKWVEKIRVFAAYLQSGAIIRPYPIGSQAGMVGEFEGGNLVLDAYNKPLRQSDGSFVTSVTSLIIVNNSAKKVKFEAEVLSGMAAESVPMYSLVQIRPGRRIVLARSTDYLSRVAGIVTEDLYTNEVGFITTEGLIRNESWNWPPAMVNRPVFCGTNGEITTTPPHSGVLQAAGFVYDTDAIYMNIFPPIILDDVWGTAQPPVPPPAPPAAPIADFYSAITSGNAPLTVDFTSTSLHSPTSFEWDFTGDGVVDAVTATAQYTYATPGTYTVKLRAINGFGFDDEVKTGYITVTLAPSTGAYTNLAVQLGGPGQVSRAHTFQVSINVTNEGHLTATNVVRRITLPDVKGQQVVPSGLPANATVTRDTERTVIEFGPIATLATGLNYGPVFFNLTAPGKQGDIVVFAEVHSPEVDSTIGNNTASMVIGVQP